MEREVNGKEVPHLVKSYDMYTVTKNINIYIYIILIELHCAKINR